MCTFSPQEETLLYATDRKFPTASGSRGHGDVCILAYTSITIVPHPTPKVKGFSQIHRKKFLAAPRSLATLAPAPALRASAAPLRAALPCGGLARHGVRRSCAPVRIRARLRPALPAPLGFVGRFAFVRRGLRWGRGHCAGVCASITVYGVVPPALR